MEKLGESNLRNFTLDTAYIFEGEDYRQKVAKYLMVKTTNQVIAKRSGRRILDRTTKARASSQLSSGSYV